MLAFRYTSRLFAGKAKPQSKLAPRVSIPLPDDFLGKVKPKPVLKPLKPMRTAARTAAPVPPPASTPAAPQPKKAGPATSFRRGAKQSGAKKSKQPTAQKRQRTELDAYFDGELGKNIAMAFRRGLPTGQINKLVSKTIAGIRARAERTRVREEKKQQAEIRAVEIAKRLAAQKKELGKKRPILPRRDPFANITNRVPQQPPKKEMGKLTPGWELKVIRHIANVLKLPKTVTN